MRAGPLSNTHVVDLLNRYFVPVYIANEDYGKDGPAADEEKAERKRLLQAFRKANLSAGTVQAFIIMDGQPFDAMHVANAAKVERLVALLERTITTLRLRPGRPVVAPTPQAAVPKVAPDALALHVTTRYLLRRGNRLVTNLEEAGLGKTENASWAALPGEDWVVLPREAWTKLLGPNSLELAATWTVDRAVATRLFLHFYPPSENNDVAKNRITRLSVQARVISVKSDVMRIRLDGLVHMEHSFHHNGERTRVDAPVIGYFDYDGRRQRILSFQLVTDNATYGGRAFGVIVQSAP
jgi:hypothetical protein